MLIKEILEKLEENLATIKGFGIKTLGFSVLFYEMNRQRTVI